MSGTDFSLPEGIHTVALGLGDINGIMRGKRIPATYWDTICKQGNALSIALFALDMTCDVWDTPYSSHRMPVITDLRADPFERAYGRGTRGNAPGGMAYDDWHFRRAYLLVPAQEYVAKFMSTFTDYPPRGKPASFSVGDALNSLQTAGSGGH